MKEVIILGGGISGLYAALNYQSIGYTVTLIEKKDRLGGNIHTIEKNGILLEAGAGRFNSDHKRLLKLIKQYGLTTRLNGVKKDFYPVLCSTSKVNVDGWIEKVILESKKISDHLLYNITFHQLCEMVLGYEKAKTLIEAFGYNAEFLIENAHASLKTFQEDFTNQYPYMSCVEGLSELIRRMEEDLRSKGVTIHMGINIEKIKEKEDRFYLTDGHQKISGDILVLALPKNALMKLPIIHDYTKALLDSVQPVALHRIYGKYTKPWFEDISKFTTDLPLRQFIPIDSEHGVAMVSYSDLFDADYWKYYADQGSELLENKLKEQIRTILPNKKIPKLEWVESCYWEEGVHVWLPGINPKDIRRQLLNIQPNLYIVGEAYSLRQGWVEGALETVDEMMNHLKKQGGSYKRLFKKYMTVEELKHIDFKWVLLTLEGKTYVIDVTQWMYQHPGTAQPFIQYMYKDITKPFHKITSHFENEGLKKHVLKMIKKYTVSQIQ